MDTVRETQGVRMVLARKVYVMDVLDALYLKRGFTATEVAIADCILAHLDGALQMNISDLAQSAHCSNSAIVRLCQKVGLNGFRDLRVELAKAVERKRSMSFEVNPDRPFIEGSSTLGRAKSIAELSRQAVEATYAGLKAADIRKAAKMLLEARRVAYYAAGDSMVSAEMFSTLLMKVGITCIDGFHKADFGTVGQLLDHRDVAVIITHSGQMMDTYERPVSALRTKGVRTIVITADLTMGDRLMGIDCLITLPQGENRSKRLATFYSQACIRYVLNCIYAEVFSENYQDNVARLAAIEQQIAALQ